MNVENKINEKARGLEDTDDEKEISKIKQE